MEKLRVIALILGHKSPFPHFFTLRMPCTGALRRIMWRIGFHLSRRNSSIALARVSRRWGKRLP